MSVVLETYPPTQPERVRVGYKTFKIVALDPPVAEAMRRYGECDHTARVISIDFSHGPVQSAEVLIHEVLHAIYDLGNIHDAGKKPSEEFVVLTFSQFLTQVFMDNPDVLKWITWCLSEENKND